MPGHRRSVRLASADYAAPGLYFVTVVAVGRVPVFGCLDAGGVRLSEAGRIAHDEWLRTLSLRGAVAPDAFVVMPDHVHLLFGITGGMSVVPVPDERAFAASPPPDGRASTGGRRGTACCALPSGLQSGEQGTARCAPTISMSADATSADATSADAASAVGFGRLPSASVPSIIRSYKSAVTRAVGRTVWQRGYHDRIVRTAREAANVRAYIAANPAAAWARRP